MKNNTRITILLVPILLPTLANAAEYHGRIVDAVTKNPLAGAFVTLRDTVVQTDDKGMFHIVGEGERIGVRAYGHARGWIDLRQLHDGTQEIALEPLTPKALYLSFYGIGNSRLRQAALDLIEATELNALVIDVKGDRGMIAYPSAIPLAAQVGAQNIITIKNLTDLVTTLRAKGIYTIARIVTFNDNPLALARPDLAVKTQNGNVWHGRIRSNKKCVTTTSRSPWKQPRAASTRSSLTTYVFPMRAGWSFPG
jgi:hypothetical protein